MESDNAQVATSQLAGNDYANWTYLVLVILAAYVVGKLVSMLLMLVSARLVRNGRPVLGELVKATARTLAVFLVVLGASVGLRFVALPGGVRPFLDTITALLFTIVGGVYAWRLVNVVTTLFESYASGTESKMDDMLVPILRTSLRVVVVVLLLVQLVQVFSHQQITSILAGLGIGGLAVALAAQDSIKNIFGSIVIIADKPFLIAERIKVDAYDGVVEELGLRSTRLRTMEGNVVTIPNGELANKSIENVGRRVNIRRVMDVTITYDMSPEKIAAAKRIIGELLATPPNEGGRTEGGDLNAKGFEPRVFFNEFNDWSLNIQVIYWYNPADYWGYMAFGDWFNTELLRRFNAEGIEMAYPTQVVYTAGDARKPLPVRIDDGKGPKA
jgi:MscS family membrane protein